MAIVAVNCTVIYTALFVERDGGVLTEKLCNKNKFKFEPGHDTAFYNGSFYNFKNYCDNNYYLPGLV